MSAPGFRNFILGLSSPELPPPEEAMERPAAGPLLVSQEEDQYLSYQEQAQNLLRGISPSYSQSLREDFDTGSRASSLEKIQEARAWIRAGYRAGYFYGLRAAFMILPYQNAEQTRNTLREMTAWVQDYQNFLESGERFSDYQRFRYLYAATQFIQATHYYLQNISSEQPALSAVAQEWSPLFENQVRQLHRHLIRYYDNLAEQGDEQLSDLSVLHQEIRLQEALAQSDLSQIQFWSQGLLAELNERQEQGLDPDSSWHAGWTNYFLEQSDYLSTLSQLNLPNPGASLGAWSNGFSTDLLIQMSATFDLLDEASPETVQGRYAVLALTLMAWNLSHPELSLEASLEMLDSRTLGDRSDRETQNLLEQSLLLSPRVAELKDTLGIQNWAQWWELALSGLERLNHWREYGGRTLMEQVFRLNAQSHPIHHLATQLEDHLDQLSSLELPGSSELAAQELFRRGPSVWTELENLGTQNPFLPVEEWLETLRLAQNPDAHHEALSQANLEFITEQLHSSGDHQVAAAAAALQTFTQSTASGDSAWNLPANQVRQASDHLHEFQSLSSRVERVLAGLVSSESLITLGAGVLYAELIPALALGSLGRRLRIARFLAPQGHLRTSASVAHGFGTGLLLGGTGALLHNHSRAEAGFETHYTRDMLQGAAINSLVFMGAASANLGVQHLLRPRQAQTLVLGRAYHWRSLMGHGAAWLTGGSLAWGLGVGARGLQTGEWSTSGDEAATHYLTLLMFELGGGLLRGLRRHSSLHRELGLSGNPIQRSLGRLLVNDALPVLGPSRAQGLRNLVDQSVRRNPSLRNQRPTLMRRFAREEFRHPGMTQAISQWVREGQVPVMVGPEGNRQLVLLPPEALAPAEPYSEANDPTPPLLLPANTQGEGIYQVSSALPQYRFTVQTPSGEVRSAPDLLLTPGRRRIILNREFFNFLQDPAETRILPREGFGLLEFLEDGSVSLSVPERLSDLSRSLRPAEEAGPQNTVWRLHNGQWQALHSGDSLSIIESSRSREIPNIFWVLREGTWQRIRPGTEAVPLDPGTTLALGRLHGKPLKLEGESNHGRRPGQITTTSHDRIPISEIQLEAESREGILDPLLVNFEWVSESTREAEIHRIALDPGEVFNLNPLRLVRDRNNDTFRLMGPAQIFFQFGRVGAEGVEAMRGFRGVDQAVVGEVGDTVFIRAVQDGRTYTSRILLDDSSGSAALLPEVGLSTGEKSTRIRFRPSQGDLNFGRLHQPSFFDQKFISRNHFDIRIVAIRGQPRYYLTVRSTFGMWVQGRYYLRGESVPLRAGQYDLHYNLEAGNDNFEATVGPVRINLPPLPRIFPGWNVQGLIPNHDQGLPPQAYTAQQIPLGSEAPVSEAASEGTRLSIGEKMWRLFRGPNDQD